MNKYKVLGEEGADVEIAGETRKVGDIVELDSEVAQPLVDEGKLEATEE